MVKNGPRKNKRTPKSCLAGALEGYAVQCDKCLKWRRVAKDEYEDLRSKHTEDPFVCNKKPNVSCDDPADLDYNSSRAWLSDKPDLPKTPTGFRREEILRKDFSKVDVHYFTPDGKKMRSSTEIMNLLTEHPEYNLSPSDFSFASPTVMAETVPGYTGKKGSTSRAKKLKAGQEDA